MPKAERQYTGKLIPRYAPTSEGTVSVAPRIREEENDTHSRQALRECRPERVQPVLLEWPGQDSSLSRQTKTILDFVNLHTSIVAMSCATLIPAESQQQDCILRGLRLYIDMLNASAIQNPSKDGHSSVSASSINMKGSRDAIPSMSSPDYPKVQARDLCS